MNSFWGLKDHESILLKEKSTPNLVAKQPAFKPSPDRKGKEQKWEINIKLKERKRKGLKRKDKTREKKIKIATNRRRKQ